PGEVLQAQGDQLFGVGVALFPDADVGEAVGVVGGVHAALVFGQGDQRGAPALRAQAVGVVDGQAAVVAQLRAREAVRPVLGVSARPHARQILLGLGTSAG